MTPVSTPPISPELADAGLSLQAAIALDDLDPTSRDALRDAGIDRRQWATLVLFAQAGSRLWDRHVVAATDLDNPFDETAEQLVADWMAREHPTHRWHTVYPGEALLPLGQLARRVGWGSTSPLGLTMHPVHGPWIAHRIAIVTSLPLQTNATEPPDHACDTCAGTPCVSACPVGAVRLDAMLDLEACGRHRLAPASACAHQCLARNACPTGAEDRYGPEQMQHHYGAGLESIRRWLEPG